MISIKTELPGPKSRALMAERQKHVPRGPFHTTPIFAARAHGEWIEDVDGNRLIDFASGIGVVNIGHTPDSVVKAIHTQAEKLLHSSFNVVAYESYIRLAAELNRLTPGTFAKKTFLANSGAEAVENAIKIARAHTGRTGVVCFEHAFHGRTYLALSLTSKAKPYKAGFAPFFSDVYRAPYPYAYRWQEGNKDIETVSGECFRAFEEVVHQQVGSNQVAAVIIEPVLGEGGFVPAPKSFLSKLRDFCSKNGIVLIADEIQCGFGRTGSLFASEQLGLVPDLMTLAKGLGGGMPISAVTGRAEMMDAPIEGGIGGTFGGNPVACEAALAVIREFESGALAKARAVGERLQAWLDGWKQRFSIIGDVRGLGPMMAIELVKNRETREPYPEVVKALIKHAYENGVVLMGAGTYGNCIRFLVPLTIDSVVLDEGLKVVENGFAKI